MRPAVTAALLALALGGCGGGGGGSSPSTSTSTTRGYPSAAATPSQAAQRYVEAFGSGDYATACALISKNTLAEVTQNGKLRCEDVYAHGGSRVATTQAFMAGATVSSAKVTGDNATVSVTSKAGRTIQLPLVREHGVWKVAS